MAYRVQIVDSNGDGTFPSHELPDRFPTIGLAEEAAHFEVLRLRAKGKRTFYSILDQDGQPVGPIGPPDIPEGYGIL
jgi:hypothetical protein